MFAHFREFQCTKNKLLPQGEYTYLEGGCIHYGEAIAYLPILGILRNYFDITEGEEETLIKQKMAERLSSLNGQLAHILSPLQELLSLPVEDQSYLALEPAQRRERVFEAIRYLLVAESQTSPLILAIEDLHWIDKTSEEFLSSFIEGLPGASILLLLYRPEYTPAWTSKTFYSQIRVDHLPERPSTELVEAILSEGKVSPDISDFIVGRTAGNPLFIEELTRGLLEAGSILKDNTHYVLSTTHSDIQVPDTIQGIIASRLDRLPEELKETIQVASVIGREFSLRLLEDVTGLSKPLKSSLMHLQSLEFIYEKSLFPEPEYIFRHALTQEVAYNSLLLKRRKEMHEKTGQAIEQLYADTLDDFYEILAHHYSLSEDTGKAVTYLKLSGDKAVKSYSNREAVRFFQEAIRLLDNLSETEESKREKLEVCRSILDPLHDLSFPEGSLKFFQEAESLSEELGDDTSLAAVYSKLSLYHTVTGNLSLGMDYSEKCFDTADKMGDLDSMAVTALDIGPLMLFTGRISELAAISRRVIELLEEQHREKELFAGGRNVFTNQCGYYGMVLGIWGEFAEGRAVFEKGLKFALEVGDIFGTGWLECFYSYISYVEGDAEGAIDHACKAIECFEETGVEFLLGTAWSWLGAGYCFLGDYEVARAHVDKGLEIQKRFGVPVMIPDNYIAEVRLADGDLDGAMESAEEALRLSREFGTRAWEPHALLFTGRIIGGKDPSQVEVAEQYIRQSILLAEEMHSPPFLAKAYLFLGEVFEKAGRRKEAQENMREAIEMWEEMGVNPQSYWLTRTQEALARLSQ